MLTTYQQLTQDSPATLGVQLPKITAAELTLCSDIGDLAFMRDRIAQLQPQAGWVVWRDRVSLTPLSSAEWQTRDDLLQAQFVAGEHSLHIQQIAGGHYQVSHFQAQAATTVTDACYGYVEQRLLLRNDLLNEQSEAQYRLWYHLQNGAWHTLGQQFMGFGQERSHG